MFGIIHADEFGAPTLVFDLIEPFRPAADRLLTRLTSEGRIDLRHFETDASKPETGVSVSREGRKILIAAFNEHLREICTFNGQTGAFKQHLYQLAGALATSLKQFWEHDPAGKLRHRRRPPAAQSGE